MNELAVMPAMTIQDVVDRRNQLVEFTKSAMTLDVDYGVVPGTTKPTLLKPGAEKLCTLFGLSPRFTQVRFIEDFTGKDYGGEPFFYYVYKCQLYRGENLVGDGEGSCSSRESKYRYRDSKRVCPSCGKDAIIKGKAEFGGGWLCFAKRGGCGEKFGERDPRIVDQPTGRVPNEDIADQANTILKMSQKRALIASTLIAVNASEFFTQDMEDMTMENRDEGKSASAKQSIPAGVPDELHPEGEEHSPKLQPGVKTISEAQIGLLVRLYSERHPESDSKQGLDAIFTSAFKHNMASANSSEASTIINQLKAQPKQ